MTGLLVYFGVGVATLSFGFGTAGLSFAAGVVATALAFGLVLLVLAYVLGPISGCHVNPAITMGVWLSGRIPLAEAVYYWVAEFVGAILGALLLWGTFSASPLYSRSKTGLGTNGWGAASHIHINAGGAFLVEVVMTALFVFAVLTATSKTANAATAVHSHRSFPHGGPSHRNPDHGHFGEPGSQPRSRPSSSAGPP